MAEVFGVVAGAVGIASAFTACVDCFEYIRIGRDFDQDFTTSMLILSSTRLRLTRWGIAVNVVSDPRLGSPSASTEDLMFAKDILFQILHLFKKSQMASQKYLGPSADTNAYFSSDLGEPALSLYRRIQSIGTNRRQKKPSILKATRWALGDHSKFKKFIDDITKLIESLETCFPPPPTSSSFAHLAATEISGIKDYNELALLENSSREISDKFLEAAVIEKRTGHSYTDLSLSHGSQAQAGDIILQGWQAGAVGGSHTYQGIHLTAGGKALLGNQYGGTKGFWD